MPAPRIDAVQLKCLNLPFAKSVGESPEMGVPCHRSRRSHRHATAREATPRCGKFASYSPTTTCASVRSSFPPVARLWHHGRTRSPRGSNESSHEDGAEPGGRHGGESCRAIPEDLTQGEGQTLVEVLRDLGHYSQHAGAWLAAETDNEPITEMQRLLKVLPEGSLMVTLDPATQVMNATIRWRPWRLGDAIRHVHVHDGVRELGRRRGIETELGRGSVDSRHCSARSKSKTTAVSVDRTRTINRHGVEITQGRAISCGVVDRKCPPQVVRGRERPPWRSVRKNTRRGAEMQRR